MTLENSYDLKLINKIKNKLVTRKQTVAVGESVTAGHLQVALSQATDAMKFFQGGITAYNLGQKARHLVVDPIHALACNCVSATIAETMAIHAAKLFSSDWGISATGYASPNPENNIKTPFAYFSISFRGKTMITEKILAKPSTAIGVQFLYTDHILRKFLGQLSGKELKSGTFFRPAKVQTSYSSVFSMASRKTQTSSTSRLIFPHAFNADDVILFRFR